MTEEELKKRLNAASKRVETWPESMKIALRVGKYADSKEELKAVLTHMTKSTESKVIWESVMTKDEYPVRIVMGDFPNDNDLIVEVCNNKDAMGVKQWKRVTSNDKTRVLCEAIKDLSKN